ncbi:MAG: hypothetical protein EA352_06525 [Gemmatimonadales bacterium]|nr:MAG: hypothetical protein EA352_06525 [Gemmatimonadales bacterium]
MPDPLRIGGTEVAPGTRRRVELPAHKLATGTALPIPVEVVHGAHAGPKVWLSGAIHGDELNGIEVIRQVTSELQARHLRGSVVAVPIVNLLGFMAESRYLPDRRDLNRSFPGSPRGSLASRLAHLFLEEVVNGCDLGIDLHTGSDDRTNAPQVRANLDDPGTAELARAFGAPLLIHAAVRDGSLRAAATQRGARVLVFEGGEARRFDRRVIEAGTRGVLRVLAALGMRTASPSPPEQEPLVCRTTQWVRASRAGLFRLDVEPGEPVERGRQLGVIRDAFGDMRVPVRARRSAVVVGCTRKPVVNRGDALIHLGQTE